MQSEFDIEIKTLRNNIDDIDQEILTLISKRQQEVEQVVALKRKHNVPVYHPAREEDLISGLRARAKSNGIEPDLMEDLYRVILRYSRIHQSFEMKQQGIKIDATVLIVGGGGEMGRYFAGLFLDSGYRVRILSRGDWDDVEGLCRGIDLAVVSVPIDVTVETIKRLGPHLPEGCILADLTSIKASPMAAMLEFYGGPVIGLHPLFGPTLSSLDKQIIAVTPGRNTDACRWLVDQLSIWGAVIVTSDPEEHDEIMEIVQTLRHFATFCFGQFLARRKISLDRTLEFSSPIYRLELGMVGRLFAQDSALYSEIIFATPSRRKLLMEFIESMDDHVVMLENNDKKLFMERFKEIADWFGPFSEQALRESTFIINKLIERF